MAITETQSAEIADAIISAWFPSGTWCQEHKMRDLQMSLHLVVTQSNPIAWEQALDNFIGSLLSVKSDLDNVQGTLKDMLLSDSNLHSGNNL